MRISSSRPGSALPAVRLWRARTPRYQDGHPVHGRVAVDAPAPALAVGHPPLARAVCVLPRVEIVVRVALGVPGAQEGRLAGREGGGDGYPLPAGQRLVEAPREGLCCGIRRQRPPAHNRQVWQLGAQGIGQAFRLARVEEDGPQLRRPLRREQND
eukprot:scaffold26563_cov107-Isochrysis_galbana.AAC.1